MKGGEGACLEKYIGELIEKGEENAYNYRFVKMGIKKRNFVAKDEKKGSGPFAELSTGAD